MAAEGRRRPQLGRGATEAFAENEDLIARVRQLEEENQILQDMLQQDRVGPVRSQTPGGGGMSRAPSEKQQFEEEAADGKAADHTEIIEEARRHLLTQLDAKDEEINQLQERADSAEASKKSLEDIVQSYKKAAANGEAQRVMDKESIKNLQAKVRTLGTTVEELTQKQEYLSRQSKMTIEELQRQLANSVALTMSNSAGDAEHGQSLANEMFYGEQESEEEVETVEEDEKPRRRGGLLREGAPSRFAGHMQKKSPSLMRQLRPYQQRFFVLEGGKMNWWASRGDPNAVGNQDLKGSVDFCINLCIIETDEKEVGRFSIRPQNGDWVAGNFTHAGAGRVLEFSVAGSEHTLEVWLKAINDHIEHGIKRAAATIATLSTSASA